MIDKNDSTIVQRAAMLGILSGDDGDRNLDRWLSC